MLVEEESRSCNVPLSLSWCHLEMSHEVFLIVALIALEFHHRKVHSIFDHYKVENLD